MQLINGRWTNTDQNFGATTNDDFWAGLESPAPPSQPRLTNQNPMDFSQYRATNQAPQMSQGGMPSLDQLTEYYRQANPADGDPAYWARQSLEKIQKGADVQGTLDYMTQRPDFSTLGGDGRGSSFGGAMGNYQPLAPFQYGGQFSSFSAPSVNAPAGFNYTGPGVSTPNEFRFPGVYAPEAPQPPQNAAPTGQQAAPAVNPHGTEENGMVRLTSGDLVPKDHPLAAQFNAWQPPPVTAGAEAPAAGMKIQRGQGGGADLGATLQGPASLAGPGGRGTWIEDDAQRAAQQQTGPGGVPIFQPPPQQAMPGPFSSPALGNATTYQGAQTFQGSQVPQGTPYEQAPSFSYGQPTQPKDYQTAAPLNYDRLGDLGRLNQSGQINPGQDFSYDPLANAPTYTPGQFTATTAADLANDPGLQFRQQRQNEAIEQSAAARGNLNTTGTMKALADYSGQLASQEFANVDQRRRQDFLTREGLGFDAFNTNEANRRGTQAQQFGQSFDTSQANRQANMAAQQGTFSNALAGAGYNRDTALAEQGTRFNQGLGAAQFDEGNRQAAYSLTEPLKLQAQAQGFGQAATTADMNERNRFNAANFNTTTDLARQAQEFGQQATSADMNERNRFNAANFNEANRLATQQQQYGQASNTYDMNYRNLFNTNQAGQENARANFGVQQGAQNQAFTQALGQAGYNAQNAAEAQQRAFTQQYQPWAQNASNQLSAGQTNASLAGQTNALNASQEQQRYLADWNAYQSQVNQNQFGAGNALNWAQYGLGAQGQNFNQNLASYTTNRDTLWGNQDRTWNQTYGLAGLGLNAANSLGGSGSDYAAQMGNLYTGLGNAQAGAGIASGNAWQSALGSLGQMPLAMYALNDQQNNRTGPFAWQGPRQ